MFSKDSERMVRLGDIPFGVTVRFIAWINNLPTAVQGPVLDHNKDQDPIVNISDSKGGQLLLLRGFSKNTRVDEIVI